LSQALNVSGRTVRRDLSVFDALQFPLMKSDPDWKEVRWWLGAMAEWPRREDAPVRELRA
jgi:hypothetical protein